MEETGRGTVSGAQQSPSTSGVSPLRAVAVCRLLLWVRRRWRTASAATARTAAAASQAMRVLWVWTQVEMVAEKRARPPLLVAVAVLPLVAAGYQYQARYAPVATRTAAVIRGP
ncbi:hypothetical protein [Streptomyces halobius]|uniref:Uncharacterized protein n=1 Tax=Streptomyces halobius TaxID=2879846 RepID=A0ABY4M162_9ACTN|nr:hypothetical protein [Streptomyces halobius]UQA91157.1 hypothetical protein K9S39_03985 [Streptomyces halobius]